MEWRPGRPSTSAPTLTPKKLVSQRSFGLRHLAGGDPIDLFTKGMDLKISLQGLGEEVSKEVYLDIMLSGLTKAADF